MDKTKKMIEEVFNVSPEDWIEVPVAKKPKRGKRTIEYLRYWLKIHTDNYLLGDWMKAYTFRKHVLEINKSLIKLGHAGFDTQAYIRDINIKKQNKK